MLGERFVGLSIASHAAGNNEFLVPGVCIMVASECTRFTASPAKLCASQLKGADCTPAVCRHHPCSRCETMTLRNTVLYCVGGVFLGPRSSPQRWVDSWM
jgi:hypothetical protein